MDLVGPCRRIVFLRNFSAEALSRVLVEHLAFVIDGAPEVVTLAVDAHEHLIDIPTPMGEIAHRLDPLPADVVGEHGAKPVPPEPHSLMANVDAAFGQKVLDLTKGQGEPDLHQDDSADQLG